MPRYIAFLRGVSPMNFQAGKMCEEMLRSGFAKVRSVLASGNIAFDSRLLSEAKLEGRLEAMTESLFGRKFLTFVRRADTLLAWVESDPYEGLRVLDGAKRIVTLLKAAPPTLPKLPLKSDDMVLYSLQDRTAIGAYIPRENDPAFMRLIEKTFGKEVTTRTWESFNKCVRG